MISTSRFTYPRCGQPAPAGTWADEHMEIGRCPGVSSVQDVEAPELDVGDEDTLSGEDTCHG